MTIRLLDDDVARTMPSIRAGFESFKAMLADGRMNAAAAMVCGNAVDLGEEILGSYRSESADELAARDPLTRFFVMRFRGMEQPADLTGAPPAAVFLMAFTAFPYLDVLHEETEIGEHVGFDEDGGWVVRRVIAGQPEGTLTVTKGGARGWLYDLRPLYLSKAAALGDFIAAQYGGDFGEFLWRYVADHDIAFDLDQAGRPLGRAS